MHKPSYVKVVPDFSFKRFGQHLRKNSLYGTFRGYSRDVKFYVPEYPKTTKDVFKIYVWTGIGWNVANYEMYKKLYFFVVGKIKELNLIGVETIAPMNKVPVTFQKSAPYGRPRKITGLKQANKLYLARADHGQGEFVAKGGEPLRRTTSGDLEVSDVSKKNIVYN